MVKTALLVATATACLLLFAPAHVAAEGRKLAQTDTACDDCACGRVECAQYCGSANRIESFTCDESGLFSAGRYYCTCDQSSGSSGSSSSQSGAGATFKSAATTIGMLSIVAFVYVF